MAKDQLHILPGIEVEVKGGTVLLPVGIDVAEFKAAYRTYSIGNDHATAARLAQRTTMPMPVGVRYKSEDFQS